MSRTRPCSRSPLTGWERLDTDCLQCGRPIRFHKYAQGDDGPLAHVPRYHEGHCAIVAVERERRKRSELS